MKIFSKKKQNLRVQIRDGSKHPFGMLSGYVPLGGADTALYRQIREAVPIVDAAVTKIIRLTGGFAVKCSNPAAERALAEFIRTVDTGRGQRGLQSFLDCYLDSMLTCGRAVGEIVTRGTGDIAAVLCGNVADVQVKEGDTPLKFELCSMGGFGEQAKVLPYQELLLFTPYNPEADKPYGVSMLRSMPFLTDVLMKIYSCIGTNFERSGNVRYAVICKPTGDILDRAYAGERAEQIAREWSEAMASGKSGSVRDFVAMGDVEIKAIGADNQMLDSEVPVRQILEQLIAKTGIPPFMLGLAWSSTERMSTQQADLMTSEITAIRRSLTPVIERICGLWMSMHGYVEDFEVLWDDINLQDCVEEARAALYAAQAEEITRQHNAEGGKKE